MLHLTYYPYHEKQNEWMATRSGRGAYFEKWDAISFNFHCYHSSHPASQSEAIHAVQTWLDGDDKCNWITPGSYGEEWCFDLDSMREAVGDIATALPDWAVGQVQVEPEFKPTFKPAPLGVFHEKQNIHDDHGWDLTFWVRRELVEAQQTPAAAIHEGTNDDEFEIQEVIGRGAWATVYRACEVALDRDVAIRFLSPSGYDAERVVNEARRLAQAHHPNVAQVYRLARMTHPEHPQVVDCVVIELVRGETVDDLLAGPRITVQQAMTIGVGLLRGVAHLHAQGVSHGDIHGGNAIVVADEGVGARWIDVQALNSAGTTSAHESRLRSDARDLGHWMFRLLRHSDADLTESVDFGERARDMDDLEELRAAFEAVQEA